MKCSATVKDRYRSASYQGPRETPALISATSQEKKWIDMPTRERPREQLISTSREAHLAITKNSRSIIILGC